MKEWPGNLPFRDRDVVDGQFQDLLLASGCKDLKCVRALSSDRFFNATSEIYTIGYQRGRYGYPDFYTTPVVDGETIHEYPSDAFVGGRFSKVPLLTDRNPYEGDIRSSAL